MAALREQRLVHSSRADTVFAQAACNDFVGSGIAVDGIWGPNTQREVDRLKARLGVVGNLETDHGACLDVLDGIATAGFADRAV